MRKDHECKDCRILEEELYWTRFQYIHFLQVLQPGFDQHLTIPEKFTKNLGMKLPDKVTLKGPSGTAWQVYLTAHENTSIFDHGWQEFVKDHSLQENDILVFKYNGDSGFDVLMLDGQSFCEKESSYFLSKCVHKEHDTAGIHTKRNRESSVEVLSGGSEQKRRKCHNVYTASGILIVSRVARDKMKRTRKTAKKDTCSCAKDVENGEIVHKPLCLSSRRLITEEHKLNALQMEEKVAIPKGLVAVMRSTNLTKKYLPLPKTWASKYINYSGNRKVILSIKDNIWKLGVYYGKRSNQGGLGYGWENFVLDNNLKEFDVCVFDTIVHLVQEVSRCLPQPPE